MSVWVSELPEELKHSWLKGGRSFYKIPKTLLWDALSSRAECSDFYGASEGSDAFRALGTCSSFCLRLKDCENVNKQLCILHAETDSTFGVTSRRGFLKTRALPPHPALALNGLYTQLVAKFLRKSFGWIL